MHLQSPAWILLLAVAGWMTVLSLISFWSGWALLAREYRLEGEFDGQQWSWQSGQGRWGANYNNCLIVGANRQGLYLAVFFPFRAGHPSLFIPWSEISARTGERLWFGLVEFRFRRVPSVWLRVNTKLKARLAAAAGDAWPMPSNPLTR